MAWIDPELAKRGFDVISEMPTWYQGAVLGVISAAIGLRGFDKFKEEVMYVMHLWDMHNRTTEEQARKTVAELTMERFLKWKKYYPD